MHKKLTITLDEEIYKGLHSIIGRGKISSFISDLIRPYVLKSELRAGYKAMAKDKEREKEAEEWSEGLMADFNN